MATDGILPHYQQPLTSSAHGLEEPNLDIDSLLLTAELQSGDEYFLNEFLYSNQVRINQWMKLDCVMYRIHRILFDRAFCLDWLNPV